MDNLINIVSLGAANELKRRGFYWDCEYVYAWPDYDLFSLRDDGQRYFKLTGVSLYTVPTIHAPSLYDAQKWLREGKKLHCQVLVNGVRSAYFWQVRELQANGKSADSDRQYDDYEDALRDCIDAALELIEVK